MNRILTARCARWLCLVCCLELLLATGANAQFFVALDGNDNATGSASDPWRTLQFAADQVGPGDRVTVRAGDYTGFHLTTSGTVGSPIEFFAEPGVVIDTANGTTPDGINLEGVSQVVIDGFSVTGMARAGVRSVGPVGGFAKFVTIRNVNAFDNGRWGIFTGFVNDLLIEDNRASGSAIEHGIYVSNSGDRPVIQRNTIFDNNANGIHMNGDASLGDDGVISDALVSRNIIFDNGVAGGSGINMDGVVNSRIENNLIYNTHASGISLYQIDGGAPSTGNIVVNNTVHVASDGRWALNIQDGSTDNTALNNILLNEHSFRGALDISADSLSGFQSDYNVVIDRFTANGGDSVETLTQWRNETGNETHSLVAGADDLFVDWALGDYHLLATAVARDAGTSLAAPRSDLMGTPRPIGAINDIGAYEWFQQAADIDGDNDVDNTDFLAIQRTDPTLIPQWESQFGSGTGAASSPTATVPEPTTLLLLLTLKVFLQGVHRHR